MQARCLISHPYLGFLSYSCELFLDYLLATRCAGEVELCEEFAAVFRMKAYAEKRN
jgi:hypothetical protein